MIPSDRRDIRLRVGLLWLVKLHRPFLFAIKRTNRRKLTTSSTFESPINAFLSTVSLRELSYRLYISYFSRKNNVI